MKISELIQKLQKAKDEWGDLPFLLDSNTYGFDDTDGWFSPNDVNIRKRKITNKDTVNLCHKVPEGTYGYIDPS